ncbi:TPA: hypothetical protein HA274_04805 [Candidatus Bathyarchaeota archaeon]|nr:hypothetical protein [Candidatus Bathyarchaeota archaeon]
MDVNVPGNLLVVLLVSIHFVHQVRGSANNYSDLGTGVLLYATMMLLVTTGFVLVSGIGSKVFKQ